MFHILNSELSAIQRRAFENFSKKMRKQNWKRKKRGRGIKDDKEEEHRKRKRGREGDRDSKKEGEAKNKRSIDRRKLMEMLT